MVLCRQLQIVFSIEIFTNFLLFCILFLHILPPPNVSVHQLQDVAQMDRIKAHFEHPLFPAAM